MFAEGGKGIIGAIILIAGGLICVSSTRRIIEQKYNIQFSKPIKYIAVILAFFSIGIFSKPTPSNTTKESAVNSLYSTPNINNETPLPSDTATKESVVSTQIQTTREKSENSKEQSNNTSVSSQSLTTKSSSSVSKKSKKKRNGYGNSYTSGRSGYIRGPRGGCYYINSNGKKVYVDHSYCN